MKALVYHGPGERGWDDVDDPTIIDPTDIVVRIDTSMICGSDLHILKGDVPETKPGTVLGHEAVGTVQEVGGSVSADNSVYTGSASMAAYDTFAAATGTNALKVVLDGIANLGRPENALAAITAG